MSARIGSVLRAYIMNGLMHPDLKFSARQEVTDLLRDISEGVGPMHFSLGYTVQQWKRD